MATAKVPLNLQLPIDLYNKVDEAAKARNIGRATYVRQLLMKELKIEEHRERAKKKVANPWELEDPEVDVG